MESWNQAGQEENFKCCLVAPSMYQDYYSEQNRQKSCPRGAYVLVWMGKGGGRKVIKNEPKNICNQKNIMGQGS